MQRIYLDNNASTPMDPRVREAMEPYFDDLYANPSSSHGAGEAARAGVEAARARVAAMLNCHPASIIFTSGGTEANNQAVRSAVSAFPGKKHILSSRVEHASVLTPLAHLEQQGYEVELLPVDGQGGLDLERLNAAIRDDTALVSLMGANNETGVLWPVAEIGRICRERGVLFHCDAVQMVGKMPLDFESLQVDYLALAGHKLHGPKGVGVLCAHRSAPVTPLVMGAGQENGRRAGTENVAGIVGLGAACGAAASELVASHDQMRELRDFMEASLLRQVPEVLVNGAGLPRLANTLSISFRHCSSAALIQELDLRGICVSAHSACQSGDLDPSHVLRAMQLPEEYLHGTLRISLSRFSTRTEVERLLAVLPGVVEKSRRGFAV